jgi:hypothetical protein
MYATLARKRSIAILPSLSGEIEILLEASRQRNEAQLQSWVSILKAIIKDLAIVEWSLRTDAMIIRSRQASRLNNKHVSRAVKP